MKCDFQRLLLHEAQSEWVAIEDPVVCPGRSDDDENEVKENNSRDQDESDNDEDRQKCDKEIDRHRDLEVEGFLGLIGCKGHLIFFDKPHHEGSQNVCEGDSQKNGEGRKVGEHGPGFFRLGRVVVAGFRMRIFHALKLRGTSENPGFLGLCGF